MVFIPSLKDLWFGNPHFRQMIVLGALSIVPVMVYYHMRHDETQAIARYEVKQYRDPLKKDKEAREQQFAAVLSRAVRPDHAAQGKFDQLVRGGRSKQKRASLPFKGRLAEREEELRDAQIAQEFGLGWRSHRRRSPSDDGAGAQAPQSPRR